MKGLGVALGAGGARGFAHVAVLRRLCAKEMVPSVITGSSMGSVIGSAFALFKDIRTVEKLLGYFVEKSAKNILELTRTLQGKVSLTGKLSAAYKTTATRSMMNEYFLYDLISSIFGKARFSDTKIPLGIVATDAQTGKKELFDYGFISDAVCASFEAWRVPAVRPLEHMDHSRERIRSHGSMQPKPNERWPPA